MGIDEKKIENYARKLGDNYLIVRKQKNLMMEVGYTFLGKLNVQPKNTAILIFEFNCIKLLEFYAKRGLKITWFRREDIQDFYILNGAEQTKVIEFHHQGQSFQFILQVKQVQALAKNLNQLEKNHWFNYYH
jgi:hypothetical protein